MKDIREGIYVDNYIRRRIMRKTNNQDLLVEIYASKYAKWIIPFFKKRGVDKVPLLISCNTLYQLPDYFKINANSFFVVDYYLYSYFYDLNYSLSSLRRNEFAINLHIKTYIEQAYIKKNIDICYALCKTSETIEDFKEEADYKNEKLSTFLVSLTDIQEEFTFLHEASHYFLENDSSVIKDQDYQNICACFKKVNAGLNSGFYDECYCDYSATSYILEKIYSEKLFPRSICFTALLLALIYVYMLRLTMMAQKIETVEVDTYLDEELKVLVLRIGGIYCYIYNFLIQNGITYDIPVLNESYEKSIHIYMKMGEDLRTIIKTTRASRESHFKSFENISKSDKNDFIKLFLNLL